MPPGLNPAAFFMGGARGRPFLSDSLAGQVRDILLIHIQKSAYLSKNDPPMGSHR